MENLDANGNGHHNVRNQSGPNAAHGASGGESAVPKGPMGRAKDQNSLNQEVSMEIFRGSLFRTHVVLNPPCVEGRSRTAPHDTSLTGSRDEILTYRFVGSILKKSAPGPP